MTIHDDSRLLYVVSLEPEPGYEERFNEWYDDEHVPELLECPGFESATRFELIDGIPGSPRYLAHYALSGMDAFTSEAYVRQAGRSPAELSPLAREVAAHRSLTIKATYRRILHRVAREG